VYLIRPLDVVVNMSHLVQNCGIWITITLPRRRSERPAEATHAFILSIHINDLHAFLTARKGLLPLPRFGHNRVRDGGTSAGGQIICFARPRRTGDAGRWPVAGAAIRRADRLFGWAT
jgi:hypothetical protein